VFGTGLLRRSCVTPEAVGLLERNPTGRHCRRLDAQRATRIEGLFAQIEQAGSTGEGGLYDAGLAYLLLSSWEAFRGCLGRSRRKAGRARIRKVGPTRRGRKGIVDQSPTTTRQAGIDVSKQRLEICIVPEAFALANDPEGIDSLLLERLQAARVELVVLEATAGYERPVAAAIAAGEARIAVGSHVVVVN
jgi:hypothetical protein